MVEWPLPSRLKGTKQRRAEKLEEGGCSYIFLFPDQLYFLLQSVSGQKVNILALALLQYLTATNIVEFVLSSQDIINVELRPKFKSPPSQKVVG